jgi:hypothetical protein
MHQGIVGYEKKSGALFFLMPVFSQALLPFVSGDLMSLSFFSARHNVVV